MHLTGGNVTVDMTRLSQKGQIVIPSELRKQLRLKEGTKFLVMGIDDTIVLRRIQLSTERMRLKELLTLSREKAEKVGFTEREVDKLIHSIRKASK